MKFITLHELPHGDDIEVNPALVFTIKAKGKNKTEGSVINGKLAVRENVDEVKSLLPRPGRKQTF